MSRLTDDLIARRLAERAVPPDSRLVSDILRATERQAQLRAPLFGTWSPAWGVLMLVLLVAVSAGALAVGSGLLRRPVPIVPIVSQSPSPTISAGPLASPTTPAPTPPGAGQCATDTIKAVAVPKGSRTAPVTAWQRASFTGLGSGRVAYLTPTTMSGTLDGVDVWIASGDHVPPAVVATLTGSGLNYVFLAPWPALSPELLLGIGHISPSGASPECVDLYLVAVDGSGVTRLTHSGKEHFTDARGLSPEGTEVAYTIWRPGDAGPAFAVVDRHGASVLSARNVCPATSIPLANPAWSPDGRRVALACGATIDVFDLATGSLTRIGRKGPAEVAAMSWTLDGSLLVATVDPSPAPGGLMVWTVDPVAATWAQRAKPDDAAIIWVEPLPDVAFAPDGRSLLATGQIGTGQTTGSTSTFVLDLGTSRLHQLLGADLNVDWSTTAWTADGSAIVYLDLTYPSEPTLRRQPLDGSPASVVGVLPSSFDGQAPISWPVR